MHWPALSDHSMWGIALVLGYPALVLLSLEIARGLNERGALASDILRQVAYLLLPTGAVWLILRVLAELPAEDRAVRTAQTAFALTGFYLLLRLAQAAFTALVDDQMRAPKLLLDILRIGLSIVWGAVVVENVWDVDLGSLFAAMGVGSIVLGFALQQFLGNLLSGLGLLSAHKFGIGDWIVVDGSPARVVEMDWRTVTLTRGGNNRMVVANSTLAKGNLVIAAHANEASSITIPMAFNIDIPPERVRAAVLEAGQTMPELAKKIQCLVTGVADGAVSYAITLPVANPGVLSGPRDEFLSRFWYVAQRSGLQLGPDAAPLPDAADRLAMLQASGAFHGDVDALKRLAQAGSFRRYRQSDVLMVAGLPVSCVFLVLKGSLSVSVPTSAGVTRLELVDPGQLVVVQEALTGKASPVMVVAEQEAEIMAIPTAALLEVMERNRAIARDINALTEARRQAIQPLKRALRAVA